MKKPINNKITAKDKNKFVESKKKDKNNPIKLLIEFNEKKKKKTIKLEKEIILKKFKIKPKTHL